MPPNIETQAGNTRRRKTGDDASSSLAAAAVDEEQATMDQSDTKKRQKTNIDPSPTPSETLDGQNEENVPAIATTTTTPTTPTYKDISSALCAVDLSGTDKVTRDEVKQALIDLYNWRYDCLSNVDSVAKLTQVFVEDCAGIQRFLNFMKENQKDTELMVGSSYVLREFLDDDDNEEHLASTIKVAMKFVAYNGIELMVSITSDIIIGKLNGIHLQVLVGIWDVFYNSIININQSNMVDMDKIVPIIASGISTLDVINKIEGDKNVLVDIKTKVIASFGRIMKNAEMIDNEKFQGTNIFHGCVRALKNSNGGDCSWKYSGLLWANASVFFYECCKENRTLLSKETDFELIVPFLIQFIKEDANSAWDYDAFGTLKKAYDIIGRRKMLKNAGIFEVLGRVAVNSTSALDAKNEAKDLMKRLF